MLVEEDEEFALNFLREILKGVDFQVYAVRSVTEESIALVALFDPHVMIADLNFGVGPSGTDLLHHNQIYLHRQ